MDDDSKVIVCAECLTASCWHGVFMCDKARGADVVVMTVSELRALPDDGNREHEDNWSDAKMIEIYGNDGRNFISHDD